MQVVRLLENHRLLVILGFRFVYGARSVVPLALGMSTLSTGFFVMVDLCVALVWTVAITLLGHGVVRAAGMEHGWVRSPLVVPGLVVGGIVCWLVVRCIGTRLPALGKWTKKG